MSANSKNLTLKEVAKALSVSTATVSNAFNRPDQLSAKLRDKILRESALLGYNGPNLAGRLLRKGESGVIGVMLADSLSYSFSDPVAIKLLQGVAEVLVEHNKQLLLLSSNVETAEQNSTESLPDGFIFYGAPSGNCFERIVQAGKPVIAVDFEQHKVGSVNIDNYQAAFNIAELVLSEDQQRISVLGMRIVESERVCRLAEEDLQVESSEISRIRLSGYEAAAKQYGLTIEPSQIWHIPVNTPQFAERAAREALTTSPAPKVLLCMSDVIALAAIRVANELGLAVPEQVKIVGFDDIPEASRSQPGLTTICQQITEKGRIAARMLLEQSKQAVTLETRLVERGSSAIKIDA
jgi:DNA-binding LacI/PurR family transcriptional regulator